MFLSLQHFRAVPSTFLLLQLLRVRAKRLSGKTPLLFVCLVLNDIQNPLRGYAVH